MNEDEEKALIEFTITDTGVGIPEKLIEHIFENFQQASSDTARLYGGTGLGLAIAKQLVETQGGTITVKSKLKEGSTFSFILPFLKTKAEVESETETMELDQEIKDIKVLVVEDIPLNQLLMKTLLDDFGFEHDIAGTGKIAIEKLHNKSYDIILMDLQMPEMNGFEATKFIRNQMDSQIPIIALTADVTTVDLKKCKAVGMNDYISKPVDERLLYRKIIDLLKKPISQPLFKSRCVDLTFLKNRTKGNSELMLEMIELYLEQTPPLVTKMKQSLYNKDWDSLHSAVHKMIPSFSIVGINKDYENAAKKIQEYARTGQHLEEVHELVAQVSKVCTQACEELSEEYNLIKKAK